jgi:phosphopentomutase
MKPFKRVLLLIFDSLGVGELPDANKYGDEGTHTLKHVALEMNPLRVPNLTEMGLWNMVPVEGHTPTDEPSGFFARMKEISTGKDTTTGHWEMMGLPLHKGFNYFPKGFPEEITKPFLEQTGLKGFLGNKPASGTDIIEELGEEHIRTGHPIIYTSGDSVLQIAWHEEKYGIDELYKACEIARKILNDSPYEVGRVIARPFIGDKKGNFKRTKKRRDFSLQPPGETVLTKLKDKGFAVTGIGKIPYIFNFEGVTKQVEAHDDDEGMAATLKALETEKQEGLIFTNLNDLDMLYGHRRDTKGYGSQLEKLDKYLGQLLPQLSEDDLLLISADHGNDPTYKGSDHTREFVPMIAFSSRFGKAQPDSRHLGIRESFADIGQTILENFSLDPMEYGKSFYSELT